MNTAPVPPIITEPHRRSSDTIGADRSEHTGARFGEIYGPHLDGDREAMRHGTGGDDSPAQDAVARTGDRGRPEGPDRKPPVPSDRAATAPAGHRLDHPAWAHAAQTAMNASPHDGAVGDGDAVPPADDDATPSTDAGVASAAAVGASDAEPARPPISVPPTVRSHEAPVAGAIVSGATTSGDPLPSPSGPSVAPSLPAAPATPATPATHADPAAMPGTATSATPATPAAPAQPATPATSTAPDAVPTPATPAAPAERAAPTDPAAAGAVHTVRTRPGAPDALPAPVASMPPIGQGDAPGNPTPGVGQGDLPSPPTPTPAPAGAPADPITGPIVGKAPSAIPGEPTAGAPGTTALAPTPVAANRLPPDTAQVRPGTPAPPAPPTTLPAASDPDADAAPLPAPAAAVPSEALPEDPPAPADPVPPTDDVAAPPADADESPGRSTPTGTATDGVRAASRPLDPPVPTVPTAGTPNADAPAVQEDPAANVTQSAQRRAAAHAQANEMLARAELRRVTHGGTRLGVETNAGDLGVIRIEATDRGDGLQLNLGSDRSATRAVLGEHLQELRDELRADGFDLGSVDVGTGRRDAEDAAAEPTRVVPSTPDRSPTPGTRSTTPTTPVGPSEGIDLRL